MAEGRKALAAEWEVGLVVQGPGSAALKLRDTPFRIVTGDMLAGPGF